MPKQVASATFIDYQTSTGIKLFQATTESLPVTFAAESKQVNLFCEALGERASKAGWNLLGGDMINIPDTNRVNRNLITTYVRLTKENIMTFVTAYQGGQIRQAQNFVQLFHCIKNSLPKTATLKILAESQSYTIGGNPVGELLFKLLTSKEVMDTRATASHLRENITNLDAYMVMVNNNIDLFNQYVKQIKKD
eukprot:11172465-Ditylum_brightwellii.AAC.1